MKRILTKTERLILHNQYTILNKLLPDEHYDRAAEAVWNGYNLDLPLRNMSDPLPEEDASFVENVLDMFSELNASYKILHDDEKSKIDPWKIQFHGFDANNENTLYGYLLYINSGTEFEGILKGNDCDSHCPTIRRYREMLDKYKQLPEMRMGRLTFQQIVDIIS